jgi:hypothetical protein
MPLIELKTFINADPETCFDLSLDIDLHMKSMEQTDEKAIGGRTGGLAGPAFRDIFHPDEPDY